MIDKREVPSVGPPQVRALRFHEPEPMQGEFEIERHAALPEDAAFLIVKEGTHPRPQSQQQRREPEDPTSDLIIRRMDLKSSCLNAPHRRQPSAGVSRPVSRGSQQQSRSRICSRFMVKDKKGQGLEDDHGEFYGVRA